MWTPLTSKTAYVERWNRLALGNKLRSWSNISDVPSAEEGLRIMVRSTVPGIPLPLTDATYAQVVKFLKHWKTPEALHFNECAPDDEVLFQGEVMRGYLGRMEFRGCFPKLGILQRMRDCLEGTCVNHMRGFEVTCMLRRYLSPAAYNDVEELLETYPDHVIELTAYLNDLGWARGRNVIIWEVRNY
jgi:hypothetical protein